MDPRARFIDQELAIQGAPGARGKQQPMAMLWKGKGAAAAAALLDPSREATRNAKVVEIVFGLNKDAAPGTRIPKDPKCAADIEKYKPPKHMPKAQNQIPKDQKYDLKKDLALLPKAPKVTWGRKAHVQRAHATREDYSFPSQRPRRPRRPARFLPMVSKGVFLIPPPAVSGIRAIDKKNEYHLEHYNIISEILERKQNYALLARLTGQRDEVADEEVKSQVGAIRTECFRARRDIKSLSGVPQSEPVSYWRYEFPLALF